MSAAPASEADREIAAALATEHATFRGFLEVLQGRHPIEAAQALKSIAAVDGSIAAKARLLLKDARAGIGAYSIPQGEGLPLPHPLDVEWRFSDAGALKLLDAAVEASRPGDTVLFLGVPMVALAARRSTQDRRFQVVGEDNAVCVGLRAAVMDDSRFLHAATAAAEVGAAVLDPPWYPRPFIRMLIEAAGRCRLGAKLFVSAPPIGVRPGIARERQELFDQAQTFGLELVASEAAALGYRSPAFELSALRAAGLGALPDWRCGDLLIFRKHLPTLALTYPEERLPAFELTISGVRLRLLAKGGGTASLRPPAKDAVFRSVSARAPGRSAANLWTTANRAMTVDPRSGLKAMLALCEVRGLWPKGLDSKVSDIRDEGSIDQIQLLLQELSELVDREVAETAALVGGGSWERSVSDARFLNGSSSTFLGQLVGAAV